jgi:hypothetical protein
MTLIATASSPAPSSTGIPPETSREDRILDKVTVYWLTNTATSAALL